MSDKEIPAVTSGEKEAVLDAMRAYGRSLNASGVALALGAIGQVERCQLVLDALESDGEIKLLEPQIAASGRMYVAEPAPLVAEDVDSVSF